jgi:methylated-DNA-[protein]-cysteine S-methyltransferase
MNITSPDQDDLARLHERLVAAAEQDSLLDVSYSIVDSPLGPLLLAATERGLLQLAYSSQDHDKILDDLARVLSPRILRTPRRLDEAARELDSYFAGTRTRFDLPLDLSLSHGFRRLVQEHLPEVGYGHTQSYGEIARAVGNPRAVRAVGTACATNPLPIVIPCHRVIRGDGSLGGYVGGLSAKTALLSLEMSE